VIKELDKEFLNQPDDEEETSKSKGGRPRTEKSGLVEFLKKRIESNEMFAFDDYDEKKESLDDYLGKLGEKDIEDLWKANIDNMKQEVASQTPQQFFESLPEELQYAAKYVSDGGNDLKGLFQALAQTEEVRSLDPVDDNDQELIIRSYLQATQFGTPEEIEEELETWKDLGVLEKKAKQFKPKLDQMQEQIVQAKIQEQEYKKQQQEQAAEAYMQNVFEALRPAEINGLKLGDIDF
jgi:integrase